MFKNKNKELKPSITIVENPFLKSVNMNKLMKNKMIKSSLASKLKKSSTFINDDADNIIIS